MLYNGRLHLSAFMASVLSLSYNEFPHIFAGAAGVVFGALALANSGDIWTEQHASMFYALVLVHVLMILNWLQ